MRSLLAVAIILSAGCASQPMESVPAVPEISAADVRSTDGQEFRLRPGEMAISEDESFFVALRGVDSDSRCPTDVTCVWAGNAAVVIGTASTGERWVWRTLNTSGDPIEVTVGDHTVRLLDLDPETRSDQPIPPASYSVLLRITR